MTLNLEVAARNENTNSRNLETPSGGGYFYVGKISDQFLKLFYRRRIAFEPFERDRFSVQVLVSDGAKQFDEPLNDRVMSPRRFHDLFLQS